jgi:hypothetical protein
VRIFAIACLALAACGDNLPGEGPPLAQADTLIVVAHFDDDMIFMQPELIAALQAGTLTTVYAASGDPVHGNAHAEHTFEAAMKAYEAVVGSRDWQCGYVAVADLPVHHCRLADRISMIGLDLPDGGIEGAYPTSMLHLVEHDVAELPILGPVGGHATEDQVIDELAEIITATSPSQIHALDLAATHGRDHSSHMISSTFAFWAAARVGYAGAMRWHRGYNVADEAETLPADDYAAAAHMLGYFEACYFGCGPCGTSCSKLDASHDTWLRRQYAYDRTTAATGALAIGDACAAGTAGGGLAIGDCGHATPFALDASGHLGANGLCLASGRGDVALAPCEDTPEQYWLLDGDGHLWNGNPPDGMWDMDYDHVRCLYGAAGTLASAPICGAELTAAWTLR